MRERQIGNSSLSKTPLLPRRLPGFPVQTDALKATSEGTHWPEGLQEQRSGKKYNASLLLSTEERSSGWSLMISMMPDDTKTGRRRNDIYKR